MSSFTGVADKVSVNNGCMDKFDHKLATFCANWISILEDNQTFFHTGKSASQEFISIT